MPPCQYRIVGSPCPPASPSQSRHCVVVHIRTGVEWYISPSSSGNLTDHILRCLWWVGVWLFMEGPVVPAPLASLVGSNKHNHKGACSHCCGSCGPNWAGQRVCCYCDNMAVVFAVNTGSARDPQLMRLLHSGPILFLCRIQCLGVSVPHTRGL